MIIARSLILSLMLGGPLSAAPAAASNGDERFAFLGNSITFHAPRPEVGWSESWGMAASSQDGDYAHKLADMVARRSSIHPPQVWTRNITQLERSLSSAEFDELAQSITHGAATVIVFLGDNVEERKARTEEFVTWHESLLKNLSSRGSKRTPV